METRDCGAVPWYKVEGGQGRLQLQVHWNAVALARAIRSPVLSKA
jgi:hypothetical protein